MRVHIVAIGDEILNGQVLNTNAHWLAHELTSKGFFISKMSVIEDAVSAIYDCIEMSFNQFDITVITGGLGPTKDDITKKVFADFFQCGYRTDIDTLHRVQQFFAQRGSLMLDVNKQQAEVPEVARVLPNHFGTAPGMIFEKNKRLIISLPGVPFEMKGIMTSEGFPFLQSYFQQEEYYSKTILTTGIGESFLADKLNEWESQLRNEGLELAYLPSIGEVKLRITTKHKTPQKVNRINELIEALKQLIPYYIYGENEQTLSGVVGDLLRERRLTIAAMESCTGGGFLNELIKTSGGSDYVKGGLVTYTNQMKIALGGVNEEVIIKHTELSEECAAEMAIQAVKLTKAEVGVGVTGLMEENNNNTFVYIAVSYKGKEQVEYKKLGNNREHNIQMTIFATLNFVRNILLQD